MTSPLRRAHGAPALAAATLLAALLLLLTAAGPASARDFPRSFLWGTANSAFQGEMGRGAPSDRRSDWWVWSHDADNIAAKRVTGDLPETGPAHWTQYKTDLKLARGLGSNAYRMTIEWSRIFPRSTAGVRYRGGTMSKATVRKLDRLASRSALQHYRAELTEIRRLKMVPFVTLQHFTLPLWLHDPIAVRDAFKGVGGDAPLPKVSRGGWLDERTVTQFRTYAAYLAVKFGDLVDTWTPINEPFVQTTSGYVNVPGVLSGNFPPGVFSYRAAIEVVKHLVDANTDAYDALHRNDRRGTRKTQVGLVQNMIAFTPARPGNAQDIASTEHADYIFNRFFLDAAIKGVRDFDADGPEASETDPDLAGKADFLGVNYYFRGRVTGLGTSLSTSIPLLDFAPSTSYRTPFAPSLPECPAEATCSGLGSEIYPEGFGQVLRTAGTYKLPIYITENGIADRSDTLREGFLRDHLRQIRAVRRSGKADVRGYLYWALTDNFEWSSGYYPAFGLYAYNPTTLKRRARPSVSWVRKLFRTGTIPG